jgi:hypothetical protein
MTLFLFVMSAQAGIQTTLNPLGSRLRGNDEFCRFT